MTSTGLRIYDSATRSLREFSPVIEGTASIYLCGATVQTIPHIGHVRSGVAFDILRNWLTYSGYAVTFVRNVTDIDDKILTKAAENNVPWWEWATIHERAFDDAYAALGVSVPTIAPRATGHITQMVEYMQRIIDAGYGYAADGNVYVSTARIPGYGSLSGQKLAEMDQGESAGTGKRDPRDFAMWKAAKPGEPSWPTPWGRGRPGWHIECTTMATEYLGSAFDIHCGGLDLKFPHHENELAQAVAAGDEFAHYWMHNGWVTLSGEKMSKSLGNTLSVPEVLTLVRPVELRYYLGSAHYRTMLEYSEQALHEAAAAYRRIEAVFAAVGPVPVGTVTEGFAAAMNDDLGVPAAIAEVFATVHAANAAHSAGDMDQARELAGSLRAMTGVLGVDPQSPTWAGAQNRGASATFASTQTPTTPVDKALVALVNAEIAERAQARAEKDWARADNVRNKLTAAGVELADSADGTTWKVG